MWFDRRVLFQSLPDFQKQVGGGTWLVLGVMDMEVVADEKDDKKVVE